MEKFAFDKLNDLLKKKGWSVNDLAAEVGLTDKTILKYTKGEAQPTKINRKKIERVLGAPTGYLISDIKNIEESTFLNIYEITSEYIWGLLKDCWELDFSIREETLTDSVLLKIRKAIPNNFLVDKISSKSERKIGADWEWFIIKEDKWLAFRIQAKKLTPNANKATYESLHYPKSGEEAAAENQCQTLILDSWKKGKIPLYCFYNYLPNELIQNLFKPEIQTENSLLLIKDSLKIDFSRLGWTFCYADYLFPTKQHNNNNNYKDIIRFTKNFKSMFGRELQDIEDEYNNINRDDNDQGGGRIPDPDSPNTTPGGAKISEINREIDIFLNKKMIPQNKLLELKKSIKIEIKDIQDLPVYAKKYLGGKNIRKFASYEEVDEEPDVPFVVYSLLEHHPDNNPTNLIKGNTLNSNDADSDEESLESEQKKLESYNWWLDFFKSVLLQEKQKELL